MKHRENRRSAEIIITVVMTVTLISTALGRAAAQTATGPGACNLLSSYEIEKAFGVALAGSRPVVHTGILTSCLFPVKDGGRITVVLRRNADRSWIHEQESRMSRAVKFRRVPGLGENAFLLQMRGSSTALCVFRGDYYLQISAINTDGDDVNGASKRLAAVALDRMPI